MMGIYALIKNGDTEVINTIVADADFALDGYYLIEIADGVYCEIGDFYNEEDGKFYVDAEFTVVAGTSST